MAPTLDNLPDDVQDLKHRVVSLHTKLTDALEMVRLLHAQLYRPKSERMVGGEDDPNQLNFLDSPPKLVPAKTADAEPEATVAVPSHERRKRGRKVLPAELPRKIIVHDVDDEAKHCGCGAVKERIGEDASEKLEVIPASIYVERHVRPKYVCTMCQGTQDDGPTVTIAAPPPQLIPKGIAAPGLLAQVITAKFVDASPFYRQQDQLARLGIKVTRSTMCGWAMQIYEAIRPLLELNRKEILAGPGVGLDETPVQVLREAGRDAADKSYMSVVRGGTPEHPAIEFTYHQMRDGVFAAELLKGFKGFVQTDGYGAYQFLDTWPNIDHGGCWAHVRRKFFDVIKAAAKKSSIDGIADKAVRRIREIYAVEWEAESLGLSADRVHGLREEKAKPLVDDFFTWLNGERLNVPPKGLLGKAINYALRQEKRLRRYLNNGEMWIDNNLTENALRPFVVGRKNWLFCGTPEGARASAGLYTLIETARANKLDPFWYLRYLFEHLPRATTPESIKRLLPQYIDPALLRPLAPGGQVH